MIKQILISRSQAVTTLWSAIRSRTEIEKQNSISVFRALNHQDERRFSGTVPDSHRCERKSLRRERSYRRTICFVLKSLKGMRNEVRTKKIAPKIIRKKERKSKTNFEHLLPRLLEVLPSWVLFVVAERHAWSRLFSRGSSKRAPCRSSHSMPPRNEQLSPLRTSFPSPIRDGTLLDPHALSS